MEIRARSERRISGLGNNDLLRKRLQEMTEVEDVSRHPALLSKITRDCPNTVAVLESCTPLKRYTCVMHVFDFVEKPDYVAIAKRGFNRVFAGKAFVHWLLDRGLLEKVQWPDAGRGDVVLYFNEQGTFKHAGLIFAGDRLLSKWGTGHLFEHGVLEVPESYRTGLLLVKGVPYEEGYKRFCDFAAENGMIFR